MDNKEDNLGHKLQKLLQESVYDKELIDDEAKIISMCLNISREEVYNYLLEIKKLK